MYTEYNGWKNRETWAVALWISNDCGLYQTVQDMAQSASHPDEQDSPISATTALADAIEMLFDEAFEDIAEMTQEGLNMLKDIGSLYRVEWHVIASNILSELEVSA